MYLYLHQCRATLLRGLLGGGRYLGGEVGRTRKLTEHGLTRCDVLRMVKRRALAAGVSLSACCHTFRATGITANLSKGGITEKAQAISVNESPSTTKRYDRTSDELTLDEIERIRI